MAVQKTHKLIRLNQGARSNPIRTNEVEGTFFDPPGIGKPFYFFGEPLTNKEADYRLIATSGVIATNTEGNVLTFETSTGSVYKVVPLEKETA